MSLNHLTIQLNKKLLEVSLRISFVFMLALAMLTGLAVSKASASDTVLTTISVASGPYAVAISSDGQFLYVTQSNASRVSVIRTSDNTVVNTINVQTNPRDIVMSQDGSRLFVANYGNDSLSVIDASTNTVLGTQGSLLDIDGLAVSSTDVYFTTTNHVSIVPVNISNYDGSQLSSFGVTGATKVAVDSPISTIYVAVSNSVDRYDADNQGKEGGTSVIDPTELLVTPDGNSLYVSSYSRDQVKVLAASGGITKRINVGSNPWGVAITPDGSEVYVANYGDGSISVIDTTTNTVARTINIGGQPINLAISPDGTRVYVTDAANDRVVVLARNSVSNEFSWQGKVSIDCPEANPWKNETLDTAQKVNPLSAGGDNIVGQFAQASALESLGASGVEFSVGDSFVQTATSELPNYGCSDHLINAGLNQPIQFIAGGFTLQSDAHGYINTQDEIWHDVGSTTLFTNTAAFFHVIEFTRPGRYEIVITEAPDTTALKVPTFGQKSVRFVVIVE